MVQGGSDHLRAGEAGHRGRAGRRAPHSRRPGRGAAHGRWGGRYDPYTLQSARHVQDVAEATQPKLLLHGHWHQFQKVRLPGQETEVIGLSYDGTRKSWLVLDLPGIGITHEQWTALSSSQPTSASPWLRPRHGQPDCS